MHIKKRSIIYFCSRDSTFRFSSKFINSVVVALVALYYFFLYLSYLIVVYTIDLIDRIPKKINASKIKFNLSWLCHISEEMCLESLKNISIPIPLPEKLIDFKPDLRDSLKTVIILPLFLSLLVCVLQMLAFIKQCKKHLLQSYKGECEYVLKAKNFENHSIVASSFHFGG